MVMDCVSFEYIEGALNALEVETRDCDGKMLLFPQVMDQLAKIWPDLSDRQKKVFNKWFISKPVLFGSNKRGVGEVSFDGDIETIKSGRLPPLRVENKEI